jgi:hypothetical protein
MVPGNESKGKKKGWSVHISLMSLALLTPYPLPKAPQAGHQAFNTMGLWGPHSQTVAIMLVILGEVSKKCAQLGRR